MFPDFDVRGHIPYYKLDIKAATVYPTSAIFLLVEASISELQPKKNSISEGVDSNTLQPHLKEVAITI